MALSQVHAKKTSWVFQAQPPHVAGSDAKAKGAQQPTPSHKGPTRTVSLGRRMSYSPDRKIASLTGPEEPPPSPGGVPRGTRDPGPYGRTSLWTPPCSGTAGSHWAGGDWGCSFTANKPLQSVFLSLSMEGPSRVLCSRGLRASTILRCKTDLQMMH